MRYFLLMLLLCVPCFTQEISAQENITVDEHKPVIINAQFDIPPYPAEDRIRTQIRWKIPSDIHYVQLNQNTLHCWAPPGKYSLTGEAITINFTSEDFVISELNIVLEIKAINPPKPPEPPGPDPPKPPEPPAPSNLTGPVHLIIFRNTESLSVDEVEKMIRLRNWSDNNQQVNHVEASPQDPHATLSGYKALINSALPFMIVVQRTTNNTTHLHYRGTLPNTLEEITQKVSQYVK